MTGYHKENFIKITNLFDANELKQINDFFSMEPTHAYYSLSLEDFDYKNNSTLITNIINKMTQQVKDFCESDIYFSHFLITNASANGDYNKFSFHYDNFDSCSKNEQIMFHENQGWITCVLYLEKDEDIIGGNFLLSNIKKDFTESEIKQIDEIIVNKKYITIYIKKGDCLIFKGNYYHSAEPMQSNNINAVRKILVGFFTNNITYCN